MLRRIFGILLALSAWYCGMSLKRILFLGSVWLFILFVVVPTVFRSCSTLQRHMVFLPYVHWPKLIDFEDPESEGLLGARNFYLQTEKNVQVGVWHILPRNLIHQSQGKDRAWFESQLSDGSPIVIYLHGNTGSRAREHRLHLYEVLQQLNYHVIAFDYRGYADSSPTVPTKTAVVHDAHKVYEHVAGLAGEQAQIVIYGHSLGTAVSCQFVAELCRQNRQNGTKGAGIMPRALVLESPFNNIHDEIKLHPMTFLWRKMPGFHWFFAGTLEKNDVGFMSDRQIVDISLPILIMHAKDDRVVPYVLGEKLYEKAAKERESNAGPVEFVSFEEEEALGHTLIYSSKTVPNIIREFVSKSLDSVPEASNGHYNLRQRRSQ